MMIETDFFKPILLEQMDQVKLMNRRDTKYWFHVEHLQGLLYAIRNDYYVLTVEGKALMPYLTTYFDTDDNAMYRAHHNGKLNRYKVRRRSYLSSNKSFLEVKFKSNKGRTVKTRIDIPQVGTDFSIQEDGFLDKNTPFTSADLKPVLENQFNRLMLVNKNFNERCTIDLNLQFKSDSKAIALDDLVIVELKTEGLSSHSPLAKMLQERRIKNAGFSKYCVGRTLTDAALKRNAFKPKVRRIERLIDSKQSLYL